MNLAQATAILSSAVTASIPLMHAGLGELITEKAGVMNLGVEGMMLMGAVAGYASAAHTGLPWLGLLAGTLAGTMMSLIFALITLSLRANQVATGLSLAIFGIGLSAYVGKSYTSATIAQSIEAWPVPGLSELPLVGKAIFTNNLIVYLTPVLFLSASWFLYRTRSGLALRAVGESPAAAHALGYSVTAIRYGATLFGGAASGLGGAYYSVAYLHLWQEQMTAGLGWIALGLVVFATWRPLRLMIGAFFFGTLMALQFYAQTTAIPIPSPFLAMLPYLATIGVLTVISRNPLTIKLHSPAALGKPFVGN